MISVSQLCFRDPTRRGPAPASQLGVDDGRKRSQRSRAGVAAVERARRRRRGRHRHLGARAGDARLRRLGDRARALLGVADARPLNYNALLELIDPEDRPAVERALARCAATGAELDVKFRARRNGQPHWLRLPAASAGAGASRRLSGGVLDIDSQMRAEEALRSREEHLRSILETVPDAMIVIDATGTIQLLQPRRRADVRLLPGPGDRRERAHPDAGARQRPSRFLSRALPQRRASRASSASAASSPAGAPTARPSRCISRSARRNGASGAISPAFVRDLTEQQRTQASLERMQSELIHVSRLSAMGEMASALAHELNQPLAAISNYMKGSRRLLAASPDPNAAKIETALDRAAEQAIRAGQIIRRLRDFVLRGESERRIESVAKLVEEAAALALVGSREQGLQLRFALDPACDRVVADRVQIQQVLVNLMRNAMEAMAEIAAARARRLERARSPTAWSRSPCRHRPGPAEGGARPISFNRSSPPRRPAWASGCRSAGRSSRPTAASCRPRPIAAGGATFRLTLPAAQ